MAGITRGADFNGFLSALESARSGIARGLDGLARDAHTVATANLAEEFAIDPVADALVDSLQQRLLVQASARALHYTNSTIGSLLDVRA